MTDQSAHISVMLDEVLEHLNLQKDEIIVDGTFGRGGYTRAILDKANCHVIGFDRDPTVVPYVEETKETYKDRFTFIQSRFGDMKQALEEREIDKVDAIVLDIGVSSMQIDQANRGFSFRFDGPLDMRMSDSGKSAADLVNTLKEEELANLIYKYGEERLSRRIAKAIITRRNEKKFETTKDLADTIRSTYPKKYHKIDPATRTFQALRIAVNDELGELERVLEQSSSLLKTNGRLIIVTFHSLEDSIVKYFLKENANLKRSFNKYRPEKEEKSEKAFTILNKKPVLANPAETQINPRARSAKLRAAIRN